MHVLGKGSGSWFPEAFAASLSGGRGAPSGLFHKTLGNSALESSALLSSLSAGLPSGNYNYHRTSEELLAIAVCKR